MQLQIDMKSNPTLEKVQKVWVKKEADDGQEMAVMVGNNNNFYSALQCPTLKV